MYCTKSLCYASLCLLFTSSLFAQKQWESYLSAEKDEDTSDPTWGLQVIRYNAPVTFTSNIPWRETAFVDRVGFLDLSVSYLDSSQPFEPVIFERNPPVVFDPDIELSNESEKYGIGYTYRQAGSPHAFSASFDYHEIRNEVLNWISWYQGNWSTDQPDFQYSTHEFETHIFTYTAGYDYYLTDHWTIDAKAHLNELPHFDHYQYSLTSRGVWNLGQDWIVLEGSLSWDEIKTLYSDFDGSWTTDLEATYYFTPQTGIGLGTTISLEDGFEENYSLSFDHYFTKSFSAEANVEYRRFDALPGIDDEDVNYTLRLGYRF